MWVWLKARPRVVYGAVDCKLQNNSEKRSFSAMKTLSPNLRNLKPRKTGEQKTGMSYSMYNREMKAANSKHTHTHTHTQSDYCNPRAHARRALISSPVNLSISASHQVQHKTSCVLMGV